MRQGAGVVVGPRWGRRSTPVGSAPIPSSIRPAFLPVGTTFKSPDPSFPASGASFEMPGTAFQVSGTAFEVPGASFEVPGASFEVPGASFEVPGAVPGIRKDESSTQKDETRAWKGTSPCQNGAFSTTRGAPTGNGGRDGNGRRDRAAEPADGLIEVAVGVEAIVVLQINGDVGDVRLVAVNAGGFLPPVRPLFPGRNPLSNPPKRFSLPARSEAPCSSSKSSKP